MALAFSGTANAQEVSIGDLLNPEITFEQDKSSSVEKPKPYNTSDAENIDDLIGPESNFPFLPDNHRDSGTGKFNSF